MKIFYSIVILVFASCSTTQVVETLDSSSYKVQEPYSQKWVGGAPGSGSGVNVYIPTDLLGYPVKVKKVSYENMTTTAVSYTDNSQSMIMARFTYPKKDTNMALATTDEYSNEVPDVITKQNKTTAKEAVVDFMLGKQKKTVKVSNIEEREMIPYPSMPSK